MLLYSDINMLIMDYFVTNGYPSSAQKFAAEANIRPTADVESIQERMDVLQTIYAGDIQKAIEKINDVNPQVRFLPLLLLPYFFPMLHFRMIILVSCTTHIPLLVLMKKTHLQSSV